MPEIEILMCGHCDASKQRDGFGMPRGWISMYGAAREVFCSLNCLRLWVLGTIPEGVFDDRLPRPTKLP
jgi:hypothetical protein